MDVEGMYKGAALLSRPAEEYVNDDFVETAWVKKACQHADIYFNLISTVNPQQLKLTNYDDKLFFAYMQRFSALNLLILTVDDLKSDGNKIVWRQFCEEFKDVEDYSFGTLLRLDARRDFSEENCILVTRIQFLAIEIARNRSGANNFIWASKGEGLPVQKKTKKKKSKKKNKTEKSMPVEESIDNSLSKQTSEKLKIPHVQPQLTPGTAQEKCVHFVSQDSMSNELQRDEANSQEEKKGLESAENELVPM